MRKVKTRIKTDRFHGDGREGGSLLYVIFFITLLSVFACGFMAVSRYHIKMALEKPGIHGSAPDHPYDP